MPTCASSGAAQRTYLKKKSAQKEIGAKRNRARQIASWRSTAQSSPTPPLQHRAGSVSEEARKCLGCASA